MWGVMKTWHALENRACPVYDKYRNHRLGLKLSCFIRKSIAAFVWCLLQEYVNKLFPSMSLTTGAVALW